MMPVYKCSNGKWRVGNGPCVYETKKKAEKAWVAIRISEHSKEMMDGHIGRGT